MTHEEVMKKYPSSVSSKTEAELQDAAKELMESDIRIVMPRNKDDFRISPQYFEHIFGIGTFKLLLRFCISDDKYEREIAKCRAYAMGSSKVAFTTT